MSDDAELQELNDEDAEIKARFEKIRREDGVPEGEPSSIKPEEQGAAVDAGQE